MKKSILFVCYANICRSPSAEAIFREKALRSGLHERFELDSAGISDLFEGQAADQRTIAHASARGYHISSLSRVFDPAKDFEKYDMIVTMDHSITRALMKKATNPAWQKKIRIITDFKIRWNYNEIPDPYFGGEEGFELVIDLLEDACQGLLSELTGKLI